MMDGMQLDNLSIYEMILDNISDAVFVLDREGRFIFVNSAYARQLHMSKAELLKMNVHDFEKTGQVEYCISDYVLKNKKQIIQFQDVYDSLKTGRKNFRQLAVMTPIFDRFGEVSNVLAILRPLNQINQEYAAAVRNETLYKPYQKAMRSSDVKTKAEDFHIVAESKEMKNILAMAMEIADTEATVLISGESGTGKEVIAQYIHSQSRRKDGPLVIVNCASLPESLLEAELFGYEKGSFTGASATGKRGLFEAAESGTLFLDEINSLPLSLQGKLLRAIETKSIHRIGAQRATPVDFRLLVATNEDIESLIREKKFRLDLYYRINVVPINLLPLREHRDDIIPLALWFLKLFCERNNKDKMFSPKMLEDMKSYDWPGNVRELKNFVERSVLLSAEHSISLPGIGKFHDFEGTGAYAKYASGDKLGFADGVGYDRLVENGVSLDDYIADCEKELLNWAFKKYGSTYRVAAVLGTSQATIMRKKKRYFDE